MRDLRGLRDRVFRRPGKPWNTAQARQAHVHTGPVPATPELALASQFSEAQSQSEDICRPQDLWQSAFDQLDQKDQDTLRSRHLLASANQEESHSLTTDIIDQVIETTKEKYENYQKKGWIKIKRSTGEYIDLRKLCGGLINAALSFKEIISNGLACDATGYAASAWAVVSLGLTMTKNHSDRRDALFESAEYLAEVLARCSYIEENFFYQQSSDRDVIGSAMIRLYKAILQYTAEVMAAQSLSTGRGVLDSITAITNQRLIQHKSSIEKEQQNLFQCIMWDKQLQNGKRTEDVLAAIDDKLLSSLHDLKLKFGLPIAEGASFDSYMGQHEDFCLHDTRVQLRYKISEWAESSESKCVFWLNGMTGTGKSTIARTVAQSFKSKGQLGASFFFKKGEADRGNAKRFISTIAKQLMTHNLQLASGILRAVEKDSDIATKAIREQFEKLIFQPLQTLPFLQTTVIVIVIDALDECEKPDEIRAILQLLLKVQDSTSFRLKVLLTSRPELHIRREFQRSQEYQELVLDKLPKSVIERDIRLFLKDRLSKIGEDDDSLSSDWPSIDTIEKLTSMSVPLFIFAATLCRFVGDGKRSPEDRLEAILQPRWFSPAFQMESIYQPVLEQILNPHDKNESIELVKEFREIVGVIVLIATPLSIHSLGQLLGHPEKKIRFLLNKLRSVLMVPEEDFSPVRILHLSFRDFLITTRNSFYVDEEETHAAIASQCLLFMNEKLRRNICDLQSYGAQHADIDSQKIERCLQPELQYCCRYWVYHLEKSGARASETKVLEFIETHFLHWLEAMSLIGMISETVGIIDKLKSIKESDMTSELSRLLYDAKRFILKNARLIFSPRESIIRKRFEKENLQKVHILPQVQETWNAALQTLEGHTNSVHSVAFSADSQVVASGSADQSVKLWDAMTGKGLQTLEGHTESVKSVAFSPDSQTVASGSTDRTIKLWDAKTGKELQTLEGHTDSLWDTKGKELRTLQGHTDSVHSVAFSPNGQIFASGSGDRTIKLWDTNGKELQTLKSHALWVFSVAFSPDSQIVASGSGERTINLWDTKTGKVIQTLKGHAHLVSSVAFSPDSQTLASGSADRTIKLWDTKTGKLLQTLEGHIYSVESIAFSPDNQIVASASVDQTVKLWDINTGKGLQTLDCHILSVLSMAISPNGKTVVSYSGEDSIKLWDTETGKVVQTLECDTFWADPLTFSPDSQILASGSEDRTIKLWDTKTGKLLQTLVGHADAVISLAFSEDSRIVVSGSDKEIIKLWDTKNGKELQTLKGHSGSVWSVAGQSPDWPNPQISTTDEWVAFENESLVWLPLEYREYCCSAMKDGTLALGYNDGRIFFIGFRTD
ncbi:hypothetical protein N7526_001321 [Penicillium atrosanguineum]|nr:hypothetical protein N7526_001321 [Penicillium atrosanguineum]